MASITLDLLLQLLLLLPVRSQVTKFNDLHLLVHIYLFLVHVHVIVRCIAFHSPPVDLVHARRSGIGYELSPDICI